MSSAKTNNAFTTAPFALEACDLVLSWDGEHTVVDALSLTVAPGETVCLVGKSGCGKTTILHALSGLLKPVAGHVLVHGKDVTGKPGHVSYMLQKDLLLPHLHIEDNVCLPLVVGGMDKREACEKAAPLFERFGLAGTRHLWPSQLSGGMRQRAAFMRTYLQGNDVVLLDEPFSALDAITRDELRGWYVQMAHELGLASVVITHDIDEALAMATRIYALSGAPSEGVPTQLSAVINVNREDTAAAKQAILATLF